MLHTIHQVDEGNQYLYCITNMTEIRCEAEQGAVQTTTVQFDKKFTNADVFVNGKWTKLELTSGELSIKLAVGETAYVLIY